MAEEYGYQRSGKKCREKFENLYKYYKKTKEGKAGRQDGKHYRFFRQLDALYGENTNPTSAQETNFGSNTGLHHFHTPSQTNQDTIFINRHSDSVSLTNNSTDELNTSSSDENDDSMEKRRKRGGGNWKVKVKELIDAEMKKVMEKQEAWLEKLMRTLEEKEKERSLREEEWSRQEAARIEKEHKFWAKERAWIEARDAALMETLQKITGREIIIKSGDHPTSANVQNNYSENQNEDGSEILHSTDRVGESWTESEITNMVQVRAEVESRFEKSGCPEEVLWEEVANKMACIGYHKAASVCKDKWESIRRYHKMRLKQNNSATFYLETNDNNNNQSSSLYNHHHQGSVYCDVVNQQRHDGSSPSNSNVGNNAAARADGCFPLFMSEGENMWENFGLKFNKGNQNP